jgi:hypothetical protein
MSFNVCKICSLEFESEKKLHMHLRSHKVTLAEYYIKYYPRHNLYTGDLLPFKNKEQYFGRDFSNRNQLLKWCDAQSDETVREYILKMLKHRVENKDLKFGPSHIELEVNEMPTIELYQKHFGSYKIFIDTREQQPLSFPNSESMKLEFGDYAVGGDDYDYTYVDRKGEQDFKSTLSKNNLERFEYELQRTKDFDSYYIVVESDLRQHRIK